MFDATLARQPPKRKARDDAATKAATIVAVQRVIAGETLTSVAASMRVRQPVLSQRVERLLLELHASVGLRGVSVDRPRRSTFVLRHHGAAVSEALQTYRQRLLVQLELPETAHHLLRSACRAVEALPRRRAVHFRLALVITAWELGLSAKEAAALRIEHYLLPDGTSLATTFLGTDVAQRRKGRSVAWGSDLVRAALDAYLARRAVSEGLDASGPYRGFDPKDRLFQDKEHPSGARGAASRFTRLLNSVARKAGFPSPSFVKVARAELIKTLLAKGCDLRAIAGVVSGSREPVDVLRRMLKRNGQQRQAPTSRLLPPMRLPGGAWRLAIRDARHGR
ncbi:MAG TPA: hypothetical protein VNK91_04440 [Burkholderiaceae bacterium]|nr:hypothetical protein [Burkholderiaceae bacterium]